MPYALSQDEAAGDPALRFQHVRLDVGGRTVLRDADLTINSGEFIGVLGPNGAGKTTLMRAALGLLPPSAGRISVFGRPAVPGQTAIGYMPQMRDLSVSGGVRGWDLVAAADGGHRWGWPRIDAAARRRIGAALDLVQAASLAERRLADLSGGERQRLLLAQSLLGQPRLLLLDEPLSNLDPSRQSDVVALVRSVQQRLGITVLFSAHELNPLLGAMDRVLYLGNGQAALGTVSDVITGPVLSRLYGSEIEVIRLNGRIFVMSGAHEIERGGRCAPECC